MNRASTIAFIDFLICMVLVFFWMFAISVMQITPKQERNKSTEMKAELVIEMTWPDGSLDDVDLWVLLPDKRKLSFGAKDLGIATLDRDDRGGHGDTFTKNGALQIIYLNKEVVAIRGILPGRYVVNAHYFRDYAVADIGPGVQETHVGPIPVTGKLTQLNPRVTELVKVEKLLPEVGKQITLFAFEVTPSGAVIAIDPDADLPFIFSGVYDGGP